MNPLEKIRTFVENVNPEVATEVHYAILTYLTDDKNSSSEEYKDSFNEWLSDVGQMSTQVVGKAIAFREIMDFSLGSKFVTSGWEDSIKYHQRVVDEYKDTEDDRYKNMAQRSQSMIDDIPRRTALWVEFGREWRSFVSRELSNEALKNYQDTERRKASQEILNPKPIKLDFSRRS